MKSVAPFRGSLFLPPPSHPMVPFQLELRLKHMPGPAPLLLPCRGSRDLWEMGTEAFLLEGAMLLSSPLNSVREILASPCVGISYVPQACLVSRCLPEPGCGVTGRTAVPAATPGAARCRTSIACRLGGVAHREPAVCLV